MSGREIDPNRSIAVVATTEKDDLIRREDTFVDSVIDDLSQNDSRAVLTKLVSDRLIPPEFLAIMENEILAAFVHVRKILIAAAEIQQSNENLHNQLKLSARTELVKGLMAIKDKIKDVVMLTEDSVTKLDILVKIMGVKDFGALKNEELKGGFNAILELSDNLGKIILEVAMRTIHAFVERSSLSTGRLEGKIEQEKGKITVKVDSINTEIGHHCDQLRTIASELFPNIPLKIAYREEHDFIGSGATHARGIGSLEFTYDSQSN